MHLGVLWRWRGQGESSRGQVGGETTEVEGGLVTQWCGEGGEQWWYGFGGVNGSNPV